MKECSKCKVVKDISEFTSDKSKKDGKYSSCKSCKMKNDSLYRINNIDKKKQIDKNYYQIHKEQIKQKSKIWYLENKDHALEIKKQWYHDNFEKVKDSKKQYILQTVHKWKEYMKTYQRERYRTNFNYRIKTILNKRIRDYVKQKNGNTLDFIGCSIDYFMSWIEFQFDDKMSWDNMGSYWHFDHVMPCASYDLSNAEQALLCYNWSNIRPCEKIENIVKKDKIKLELISKQQQLALHFKSFYRMYQD